MEYTQLLMMFSVLGLIEQRCICKVELLLKIVLTMYEPQIFLILSDTLLTQGRQTVAAFWITSTILLSLSTEGVCYDLWLVAKDMCVADHGLQAMLQAMDGTCLYVVWMVGIEITLFIGES